MYICAKRIDHTALVVVQYNGKLARVLLKSGKRHDFASYSDASKKVWHISSAGVQGFDWTGWMSTAELEARINARLDRALRKELSLSEETGSSSAGAFERKAAAEAFDNTLEEEANG